MTFLGIRKGFSEWLLRRLRRHSSVWYRLRVPDPNQPIPLAERKLGPSGVLIPFNLEPLNESKIRGRVLEEISTSVGTYGMGGAGFFGLRFGEEWLVIAIWGAGDWILVDNRMVEDFRAVEYNRPRPWIGKGVDELTPHLVGSAVSSIIIEEHHVEIRFSNGSVLEIDPGPERRPIFKGSGKPRRFLQADDLREAVFLSPTTELWT